MGLGLRGEGEAADKTDVPGDDRGQKKRRGLPRGVRPWQKILGRGRGHGRFGEKGVETPADNLGGVGEGKKSHCGEGKEQGVG